MYILKNAWLSIKRNKGRNLLIGIIITVIACATAITLAIKNSASTLIDSYENKYEVTATIGINRESMHEFLDKNKDATDSEKESNKEKMSDQFKEISNISSEDIDKYGDSKYVKSYYYKSSIGVNSTNLEKVTSSNNDSESNNNHRGPRPGGEDFNNINNSDFTLVGYSSYEGMEDFINGKYTITDGEVSSDIKSDTCVINSELATSNNIKVGDKITLTDPDDENNKVTLEVTGIYKETSDKDDSMGMFTSSANMIITNTNTVNKLTSKNSDIEVSTTPTFILTSKDVIDKFTKELSKKGLSEYLTVTTNLDEVESATSTISNVANFATTFLIITLIIGMVVLLVINMINIRERKYEIGVLRTIGMKKRLVTTQFILELLIVAVVSLGIGAGIGAATSVPIANKLLSQEINNSKNEVNDINKNFSHDNNFKKFDHINGITNIEKIDKINAVVDIKVLGELFIIGIIITLVSSTTAMISIERFSPLTILKERS